MTDSERNHGFGAPHPQEHGGQPHSSRKDTHPETVDFEPQSGPLSQDRQYSNPFAHQGAAHPTQQFPTQEQSPGQQGWQGQQNQWGQQTAPAGGSPAAYPQQATAHSSSSNGGKMVLIAVLILAVLLVIAALGYLFFFKNSTSGHQAQPPLTTGVQATEEATGDEGEANSTAGTAESPTSSEQTTSSEPKKRPEHPELPAGAEPVNDAARNNEPGGNFNSIYRGSTVTSEAFANIVRDEYVKHYVDTKELNATISAYSPVTKQTYTMDCSDNGKFVTCTGGNNAIVYIL
ncbi:SpoIIIAH-like family protein [Corynebacterium singulare]|uniref:SpoIIIAH-like family protein n=1 Tax=Corynebacterium singulare TaxID=161899 RepID=UPI00119F8066|nr:SpoIIIAH-like family protein [Corynebacterium singulare]